MPSMMDEPFLRYFILSGWQRHTEIPRGVGAKFWTTLEALGGIDPIFSGWKAKDLRKISSLPLNVAQPRFATVIQHSIDSNDFDQPSPECGYHASASAGTCKDPRFVTFTVDAGGKVKGGTNLEFGDYFTAPDPAIITYPLLKAALLAINAIWCAPWACVQAFRCGAVEVPIEIGGMPAIRMDSVPQSPPEPMFPYSIFHIPWIAYLSAELAAGLKLAPEIIAEHTRDGGLLMSATMERLDPINPLHARCARLLAEALIARVGDQRS